MNIKRIFVIFFLILSTGSASQIHLDEHILSVPGVQHVYPVDINGDQLLDLIVYHIQQENPQQNPTRRISIFLNQNGFNTCHAEYQSVSDVVMDWADINQDGLLELAFIRPESICFWNPLQEHFQILTLSSMLFSGADPLRLPRWPCLFNVDSEPTPEILIPYNHGIHIYKLDSLGMIQLFLCLRTEMNYMANFDKILTITTQLPNIYQKDMNNDLIPDILLLSGDKMTLFLNDWTHQANQNMKTAEKQMRFAIDDRTPSMLEALAPADHQLEVTDLNQDGYADLLLSRASKAGFARSTSQIQLYFSRKGEYKSLPDQVLMADNFFGDHIITDLNHDGLEDLALLQFPIGLIRAARFLLTRRMKYGFDLYYQQPDSNFANTPNQELRFTRRSKLSNVLRPELATFLDWNGDSMMDLLVNVNHSKIILFIQQNNQFPDKPSLQLNIPVSSHHWAGDLNMDRYDDLLFWYPTSGSIRVLMNRNQP